MILSPPPSSTVWELCKKNDISQLPAHLVLSLFSSLPTLFSASHFILWGFFFSELIGMPVMHPPGCFCKIQTDGKHNSPSILQWGHCRVWNPAGDQGKCFTIYWAICCPWSMCRTPVEINKSSTCWLGAAYRLFSALRTQSCKMLRTFCLKGGFMGDDSNSHL